MKMYCIMLFFCINIEDVLHNALVCIYTEDVLHNALFCIYTEDVLHNGLFCIYNEDVIHYYLFCTCNVDVLHNALFCIYNEDVLYNTLFCTCNEYCHKIYFCGGNQLTWKNSWKRNCSLVIGSYVFLSSFPRNYFKSKKFCPVKGYHFLSTEIASCQKWNDFLANLMISVQLNYFLSTEISPFKGNNFQSIFCLGKWLPLKENNFLPMV